ncbi:hypothetical protein Vretifemale_3389, partial [Volvox reticuliferus]
MDATVTNTYRGNHGGFRLHGDSPGAETTATASTSSAVNITLGDLDPNLTDDELVDCLVGTSGITKRQFQAFATLVDEVYEAYGISGAPRSGSSRRRVPYRH